MAKVQEKINQKNSLSLDKRSSSPLDDTTTSSNTGFFGSFFSKKKKPGVLENVNNIYFITYINIDTINSNSNENKNNI